MTLEGTYEPSAAAWVRDQVAEYEASNGERANTLRDTGQPVIVVTMRGKKEGTLRKIALMRVEHGGEYALVASMGGAPTNPSWYYNLTRHPDEISIQDGATPHDFSLREVEGDEKALWWERAVAAFPNYFEYQEKTTRVIPVLVATPKNL
jgi:deazaflavin-dependent oxidoreductase (nitroreductase family)